MGISEMLELAGIKLSTFFWGVLGGVVSAMLGGGGITNRALNFIVGTIFAVALGPAAAELADYYLIPFGVTHDSNLSGAAFFCGSMGLTAMVSIRTVVPKIIERFAKILG